VQSVRKKINVELLFRVLHSSVTFRDQMDLTSSRRGRIPAENLFKILIVRKVPMKIPANNATAFAIRMLKWMKRQVWSFIVAYMIGLHNFYYGDDKSQDDIKITVENNEVPGDDAPFNKRP